MATTDKPVEAGVDKDNFSLEQVAVLWEACELNNLQRELEQYSILMVEQQKSSMEARKKLAEMTKLFRKAEDSKKLVDIKGVLKAYQSEIDSLTKRTKSSEGQIVQVYSKLNGLPDPTHALNKLKTQLDTEVKQNLRLNELEAQLLVKDKQLEETQQKLEKEVKLREQFDSTLVDQIAKKELELKLELKEQHKLHYNKEIEYQQNISELERQVLQLQDHQESLEKQLNETKQRQEESSKLESDQYELLVEELQTNKTTINQLTIQNQRLKEEVDTLKGGETNNVEGEVKQGGDSRDLEKELGKLFVDLEAAKVEIQRLNEEHTKQLVQVKSSLDNQVSENKRISQKLAQFSDYDQIKNELEVLKFVEFPDQYDSTNDATSPKLELNNSDSTLMASLVRKNKLHQQSLTQLNLELKQVQELKTSLETQLEESNRKNVELNTLVTQLETDLMQPTSPITLHKEEEGPANPSAATPTPLSRTGSSSMQDTLPMVHIVSNQRDRFRNRTLELEEELRTLQDQIKFLTRNNGKLYNDNLKLYERVRFHTTANFEGKDTSLGTSTRIDVEEAYKRPYDEQKNPFLEFKTKEATRRYQTLNMTDRVALTLMRLFLQNHLTRAILVVYLLSLHILIMFTLYHFSSHGQE